MQDVWCCFQCQAPQWAETYAGVLRSTAMTMQVAPMHANGSYTCKWPLCIYVRNITPPLFQRRLRRQQWSRSSYIVFLFDRRRRRAAGLGFRRYFLWNLATISAAASNSLLSALYQSRSLSPQPRYFIQYFSRLQSSLASRISSTLYYSVPSTIISPGGAIFYPSNRSQGSFRKRLGQKILQIFIVSANYSLYVKALTCSVGGKRAVPLYLSQIMLKYMQAPRRQSRSLSLLYNI